ncbi:MAG: 50S ribosomal protein L24 [Candidatus Paraimprobicoccus trichonymphae]|uniref:Large ribosomal subunit protein uL24 n=1 Tax=Candidatus Paraimprobicoccus trichonymphae TaxID=3033793 RepID=A0AA48I9X5_9FIRM|nr:MAG: 50S ribosomal protein L24 [Candidatus Paraimprobicoccus trichonymphae]
MRNKIHVKTGDLVAVISGKDKNKQGKIIAVSPKEKKLMVKGINLVSKHVKAKKADQESGIKKTESALYACKVQLVCPTCKKKTRVNHKLDDSGKKHRYCKKCNSML